MNKFHLFILLIRKLALLFAVALFIFTTAEAQNHPLYSQYMFNTLLLNPAYAGSQENLSITAMCRKQWLQMDGAPSTHTLSAHSPVPYKNIALGVIATHDNIGVTDKSSFNGIYTYRIKSKKSILSLGIQAGVAYMNTRFSQLKTRQPGDPHMSTDRSSWIIPGFGAGTYWYSEKFYLGFSVPDLLEAKMDASPQSIRYRHVFAHGAYVLKLSYQLKFIPGFLIRKIQGSNPQVDINNVFVLNDVMWFGVSYRSNTSVNFLAHANITNQLQLGYAYDFPLGKFARAAGVSHEIKVSYRFVFHKDQLYMPRYF